MKRVEGVHASFVGRDGHGIVNGDRCLILSDEGTNMHVRWTTGTKSGEYDQVRPRDLVADASVDDFADEFAFEAGRAPIKVAVNVEGVFSAGGTVALFEALEENGHFDTLRHAAREAVALVRDRLSADEEWTTIRQALGASANDVEASAIIAAIESVSTIEESDDAD